MQRQIAPHVHENLMIFIQTQPFLSTKVASLVVILECMLNCSLRSDVFERMLNLHVLLWSFKAHYEHFKVQIYTVYITCQQGQSLNAENTNYSTIKSFSTSNKKVSVSFWNVVSFLSWRFFTPWHMLQLQHRWSDPETPPRLHMLMPTVISSSAWCSCLSPWID